MKLSGKLSYAVIGGLASLLAVSTAYGQEVPVEAAASCFQAPAALSATELDLFRASPENVLRDYAPGLPLSTRVRSLAGSSLSTVDVILKIAATATPEQRASIGSGLARAAKACVAVDQRYAMQIQQSVAGSNLAEIITAFSSASDDVQTAALGGASGAAGGAAGIGGGGLAGPGAGTAGGDASNPTANAPGFSSGGAGRFFRSSRDSGSPT
jgi:hypothetical protein